MSHQPDAGVTFRVRCRTKTCKHYREVALVKMPRQDHVVLWSEPRCVSCLAVMETVNRELVRAIDGADERADERAEEEPPAPPAPKPPAPAPKPRPRAR